MADWISVKERLPEPLHDVLVYDSDDECREQFVTCHTGRTWCRGIPTHWQPLPEPPEVQG